MLNFFAALEPLIEPLRLFRAYPGFLLQPRMAWWRALSPIFDWFMLNMAQTELEYNDLHSEFVWFGHYPKSTSAYNILHLG